jgi:hypothetical protein
VSAEALKAISATEKSMPQKLRALYQGPLEVIEVVNPLAYRLCLPKGSKAHDVFPLVYLLPYKQDPSRPRPQTTPGPLYTGGKASQLRMTASSPKLKSNT